MVVSVYSPSGIVTGTLSIDTFYETVKVEEDIVSHRMTIEGLPHSYTFWNKYVLTYNALNKYAYNDQIIIEFEKLSRKWDSMPKIKDFMPYLKKMIVETHNQFIGIMSAYDTNDAGVQEQYVYQILGEDIRRVNVDDKGNLNYNCLYLEVMPCISKLFQSTKLHNGDNWEETPDIRLRCDLYSLDKAIDLCKFMLRTNYYMDNINNSNYDSPLKVTFSVVTKDKIEFLNKTI